MQSIAFTCKDLHVENHRTSGRFGDVRSFELHLRSHRKDIRVAASRVRTGGAIEHGVNIVKLKLCVTDTATVNIRWIGGFVRRHFRFPAKRP